MFERFITRHAILPPERFCTDATAAGLRRKPKSRPVKLLTERLDSNVSTQYLRFSSCLFPFHRRNVVEHALAPSVDVGPAVSITDPAFVRRHLFLTSLLPCSFLLRTALAPARECAPVHQLVNKRPTPGRNQRLRVWGVEPQPCGLYHEVAVKFAIPGSPFPGSNLLEMNELGAQLRTSA
jgi:hypothetical protein